MVQLSHVLRVKYDRQVRGVFDSTRRYVRQTVRDRVLLRRATSQFAAAAMARYRCCVYRLVGQGTGDRAIWNSQHSRKRWMIVASSPLPGVSAVTGRERRPYQGWCSLAQTCTCHHGQVHPATGRLATGTCTGVHCMPEIIIVAAWCIAVAPQLALKGGRLGAPG